MKASKFNLGKIKEAGTLWFAGDQVRYYFKDLKALLGTAVDVSGIKAWYDAGSDTINVSGPSKAAQQLKPLLANAIK